MKKYIQKLPLLLIIGLSLLILVQIAIVTKESYARNGEIIFFKVQPQ